MQQENVPKLLLTPFGMGWMARQDGNTTKPNLSGKELDDYMRGYRWQDRKRTMKNVWGKEIEHGN